MILSLSSVFIERGASSVTAPLIFQYPCARFAGIPVGARERNLGHGGGFHCQCHQILWFEVVQWFLPQARAIVCASSVITLR